MTESSSVWREERARKRDTDGDGGGCDKNAYKLRQYVKTSEYFFFLLNDSLKSFRRSVTLLKIRKRANIGK